MKLKIFLTVTCHNFVKVRLLSLDSTANEDNLCVCTQSNYMYDIIY